MLASVPVEAFSLHPLAVENAGKGSQRPTIDDYEHVVRVTDAIDIRL